MPEINRVDALIHTLQSEGRIASLERELQQLDLASLAMDEQTSWWHAYGIAAFHERCDAEALRRFEAAYAKFPEQRLAVLRAGVGLSGTVEAWRVAHGSLSDLLLPGL